MPYRPSSTLLLTAVLTAFLAGCSGGETTLQWDRSGPATGAVGSSPTESASPASAPVSPSTVVAAQGVDFWERSALLPDGATDVDAQLPASRGAGRQATTPPRPQATPIATTPSATAPSEAATTPAGEQVCVDPAVLMDGVCDEPASHVG
jgi:hypothetical protein